MSEIRLTNISSSNNEHGPVISGISTVSSTGYVQFPSGTINERPILGVTSGSVRYNEIYNSIEFYDGEEWKYLVPSQLSTNSVGIFVGGYRTGEYCLNKTIDSVSIATRGNSQYFGDLLIQRSAYGCGQCSSNIRAITRGGSDGPAHNILGYITYSTKGNETYFGDTLNTGDGLNCGACSNNTRGILIAGSPTNAIQYVTIATMGNTTSYGTVSGIGTDSIRDIAGLASQTRGVFSGGYGRTNSGFDTNTISYFTISTGGNSLDFGDLSNRPRGHLSCSNSIRGVFASGEPIAAKLEFSYSQFENIQYITIATTGNSLYFGNMANHIYFGASANNNIRGLFTGGYQYDKAIFTHEQSLQIQEISISTLGDSINFGNLTARTSAMQGHSNSHGGI